MIVDSVAVMCNDLSWVLGNKIYFSDFFPMGEGWMYTEKDGNLLWWGESAVGRDGCSSFWAKEDG